MSSVELVELHNFLSDVLAGFSMMSNKEAEFVALP